MTGVLVALVSLCLALVIQRGVLWRRERRVRANAQQGRTVSDLVREAVAQAYGRGYVEDRIATLAGIAGLWRDRDDLGGSEAYVSRLRRDTRRRRNRD